MALPNIRVYIRPDSSFVVGGTAVLGTTVLGVPFLLGPPAGAFYELSTLTTAVSIRRGRTRVTDQFDAGTASVTLVDKTGIFSPDNTSSPLYVGGISYVKPLRQFRITATINSVEYDLFNGYTNSYNYDYQAGISAAVVTISAFDAFRLLNLATINTSTWTTNIPTYGESSGSRITKILTYIGVPNGLQVIETGDTNLDSDPFNSRSALAAIQQIEDTEFGAFFMSAEGKFVFKARHTVQQLASGAITAPLVLDETTGIDYVSIGQTLDDEQVYNDVSVNGGGSNQTVTDATSISTYFTRSLARTSTLTLTSSEALDYARFLLFFRKNPSLLFDSVVMMPMTLSDTDAIKVITAEVLNPVTVSKSYGSGGTLTRTLTIQSIEHDIRPDGWVMSFATAEPVSGDGFILDSATYGILDTNTLSY